MSIQKTIPGLFPFGDILSSLFGSSRGKKTSNDPLENLQAHQHKEEWRRTEHAKKLMTHEVNNAIINGRMESSNKAMNATTKLSQGLNY